MRLSRLSPRAPILFLALVSDVDTPTLGREACANWTQLSPCVLFTYSGASINTLENNPIMVGGINPVTDAYRVDTLVHFRGSPAFVWRPWPMARCRGMDPAGNR